MDLPKEQPKSSPQEKDDGMNARPEAAANHKPKAKNCKMTSHGHVRPFVSVARAELEMYMEDDSPRLVGLQMGSSARVAEEDGRPSVQDSELASLHRPRKEMLKLPLQELDPGNSVMVL